MDSKSLWKSVVVKSLRMGWPAGLKAAMTALSPAEIRYQMRCGIFEDVFPLPSELQEVLREIETLDFEGLCSRQTHHGQGLSPQFCDLEEEAVREAKQNRKRLYAISKEYGFSMPRRAANCFWTWLQLKDEIVGGKREVDSTPFRGVPLSMADGHTKEGRELGQRCTILSGFYHQHRRLGELVQKGGWEAVRNEVHQEPVLGVAQQGTLWK